MTDEELAKLIKDMDALVEGVLNANSDLVERLWNGEECAQLSAVLMAKAGVGALPTEQIVAGAVTQAFSFVRGHQAGYSEGFRAGQAAAMARLVGLGKEGGDGDPGGV